MYRIKTKQKKHPSTLSSYPILSLKNNKKKIHSAFSSSHKKKRNNKNKYTTKKQKRQSIDKHTLSYTKINQTQKNTTKKQNGSFEEEFRLMYQPFQQEIISKQKGGIFCYMPYDALDKYEKSIFKIDTSNDIDQTIKDLQKYYPSGFFVIATLRLNSKLIDYEQTKQLLLKRLIKNGGKSQPNFDKGWIYCLENSIHDSFNKLSTENANGILNIYHLSGRNKDTFEMIDKHITDVPIFTGKVVYHT